MGPTEARSLSSQEVLLQLNHPLLYTAANGYLHHMAPMDILPELGPSASSRLSSAGLEAITAASSRAWGEKGASAVNNFFRTHEKTPVALLQPLGIDMQANLYGQHVGTNTSQLTTTVLEAEVPFFLASAELLGQENVHFFTDVANAEDGLLTPNIRLATSPRTDIPDSVNMTIDLTTHAEYDASRVTRLFLIKTRSIADDYLKSFSRWIALTTHTPIHRVDKEMLPIMSSVYRAFKHTHQDPSGQA